MTTQDNSGQRLNKYLALQLGISRREADELISKGKVVIDGKVAVLGSRASATSHITVNNQAVTGQADLVYIALNKPEGYVCSRNGQGAPTIYQLLPDKYHRLNPVGRLDKNSSGIILLTNDGDLAYHMTHPKFHKVKIYKVRLDHDLEPLHQQMIADFGVDLDDGRSQLGLERLSDTNRQDWQITMSEGRNRQIRRTFSSLGYEVVRLHRTNFGDYALGELKRGEFREFTL